MRCPGSTISSLVKEFDQHQTADLTERATRRIVKVGAGVAGSVGRSGRWTDANVYRILFRLVVPSFHNRLHYRIFEIAVELPVWIIGLNRDDSDHLLFWINPKVPTAILRIAGLLRIESARSN
jgi:hypothetical protein